MPALIHEELRRLREAAGLSRSELQDRTVRIGDTGVGQKTIQAIESNPGRIPDADIIERLAAALDVDPDHFYEYPIAVARRTRTASQLVSSVAQAQGQVAQRTRARRGKPAAELEDPDGQATSG